MASTRLPGKAMIRVRDKTILEHVLERVRPSRFIEKFAIATSSSPADDIIEDMGDRLRLAVFRGSETDVLDRCYKTAKAFGFDPVVRVTADDPFQDFNIIDQAAEIYLHSVTRYDMVCNTLNPTYPEGLGTEIVSFACLKRIANESNDPSDREHVTTYILNHPQKFRIFNMENPRGHMAFLRLTLDTTEDLEVVKNIYNGLYDPRSYMTMDDIVEFISKHPQIMELNKNVPRTLRYSNLS